MKSVSGVAVLPVCIVVVACLLLLLFLLILQQKKRRIAVVVFGSGSLCVTLSSPVFSFPLLETNHLHAC